jgi:hypothetical protein
VLLGKTSFGNEKECGKFKTETAVKCRESFTIAEWREKSKY